MREGRIVCYLSDDDLLLADHAPEMAAAPATRRLRPFALRSASGWTARSGTAQSTSRRRPSSGSGDGSWNAIGLTGAAHTMAAYRRLPHGWRPAPAGDADGSPHVAAVSGASGFAAVSGIRLTHLHFPDADPLGDGRRARVAEVEAWVRAGARSAGFRLELERLMTASALATAAAAADESARRRDRLDAVYGVVVVAARRPGQACVKAAFTAALSSLSGPRDASLLEQLRVGTGPRDAEQPDRPTGTRARRPDPTRG